MSKLAKKKPPHHSRLPLAFVLEESERMASDNGDFDDKRQRYAPMVLRENCPASQYISNLGTEQSKSTMTRVLNMLSRAAGWPDANETPWAHLSYSEANKLLAQLSKKALSASTYKLYAAALRGVAVQAYAMDLMSVDIYQRLLLIKPPKGIKGQTHRKALSPDDVAIVFQACQADKSVKGVRDLVVLGLLYFAGLRRTEVGVIEFIAGEPPKRSALSYIDFSNAKLQVLGKGNKHREVTLNETLLSWLEDYIHIRGESPGPLVQRIRGHKHTYHLVPQGITGTAVYDIIQTRCSEVKLQDYTPHDFRRTFGSALNAKGVDIKTIQELLGHDNINTTSRYVYVDDEHKKQATDLLNINN